MISMINVRYLFPVRLENGRYRLTLRFLEEAFSRLAAAGTTAYPSMILRRCGSGLPYPSVDTRFGEGVLGDTFHSTPARFSAGGGRGASGTSRLLSLSPPPGSPGRLANTSCTVAAAVQEECWETLSPGERHGLMKFTNVFLAEDAWRQN